MLRCNHCFKRSLSVCVAMISLFQKKPISMCNHDITVSKAVYLFQNKKDGNDQETIQSTTTPDPGYQMGK